MANAVRVRNYRETMRALQRVNKGVAKVVRDELKEAASPVVATAKRKLSAYAGASVGTIGPKATTKGVFVTQRARKVTGLRPDFGSLQMREVMIPALEEHEDEIVDRVGDAFDRLTRSEGF